MPAVREVVLLLVFFAVFLFLIQHSFELCQAVYEVTRLAHRADHRPFSARGPSST